MEWNIKDLDCSRMIVNPLSPTLVTFLESKMPQIKNLDIEYTPKVFTKAQVFRWVILMYDVNSEIQARHSLDWFSKKYEAAGYSGFELKKSRDGYMRFDERVDNMVLGKNDAINDLIIAFLGWSNITKWNYTVFLQESMLSLTRDAIGRNITNVTKTSKEYRELYNEFHKLSNEIGHTFEETQEFVSRFYYQIEQSRLAIKPEDFAKSIAGGDDLRADNPFSVSYVVDKIRFLGDDENRV